MKQKDIALIIMVVFVSGIIAFVVSSMLFGASSDSQKAEVVQPISANFEKPDSTYFNSSSINPTKTITIGTNSNPTPF
ncbi:MAG TPA: hypothetical protein VHD60_01135 [Candidatus Saccharimonadales bacterium]|nr:hypothetical protein [Candidatus Saccharimonadales bacterium]